MINYDIPWNPVRLEQRMGRIHRYLQEKDCLVLNFVSTNTREGRVLHKLFERLQSIESDLDPQQTGKIFNVLGDVFAANQLERMLRDMYTRTQCDREWLRSSCAILSSSTAHPANPLRAETYAQLVGFSVVDDTLDQSADDSCLFPGLERFPHRPKLCECCPKIACVHRLAFQIAEFQ
jgi:hypothetical protein